MKHFLFTALALLLACSAFAQVADSTEKEQIRYNQYGVPVNRKPLFSIIFNTLFGLCFMPFIRCRKPS